MKSSLVTAASDETIRVYKLDYCAPREMWAGTSKQVLVAVCAFARSHSAYKQATTGLKYNPNQTHTHTLTYKLTTERERAPAMSARRAKSPTFKALNTDEPLLFLSSFTCLIFFVVVQVNCKWQLMRIRSSIFNDFIKKWKSVFN